VLYYIFTIRPTHIFHLPIPLTVTDSCLNRSSLNMADPIAYVLGAYGVYKCLVAVHFYRVYQEDEYWRLSGKRRHEDPDLYDSDGNYDPPP
jgi:hypothetical protein